jgi:hypothetical protein
MKPLEVPDMSELLYLLYQRMILGRKVWDAATILIYSISGRTRFGEREAMGICSTTQTFPGYLLTLNLFTNSQMHQCADLFCDQCLSIV